MLLRESSKKSNQVLNLNAVTGTSRQDVGVKHEKELLAVAEAVCEAEPVQMAEVRQAVRREGALRLEDYWIRRSARAFFDLDAGLSILEPASQEMARLFDWSEETRVSEVRACRLRHDENNALFKRAGSNR